ncbi:MAG: hypothetical protein P9L91_07155 [Candidatus Zophobacter franzmannii]|nr:hypothetical protein [Candidatus Zophobacter franzmannii]
MKKIILVTLILFATVLLIASPRSKGFAGSFLMRAKTTDALFWNPANLNSDDSFMDMPLANTSFEIYNNAFSIETYNSVAGKYIDQEMKEKMLKNVDGNLKIKTEFTMNEFAWTAGNTGLAMRTTFAMSGKFSEEYLRLILFGNSESYYEFSNDDNQIDALSYIEFLWSYGGLDIPYVSDYFPAKWGVSLSPLVGINSIETMSYSGHFDSGIHDEEITGADFEQEVVLLSSTGGLGFKGLLGVTTEPIENLEVGISFDNIFGNIWWNFDVQELHYSMSADSVYLFNLDEDFYQEEEETISLDSNHTSLPFTSALGVMYTYHKTSLSADYRQAIENTAFTTDRPVFSLGFETMWEAMPIQMGVRFGNSLEPTVFAWGLGYRMEDLEFGFNVQTQNSILPNDKSNGIAIGLHWRSRL